MTKKEKGVSYHRKNGAAVVRKVIRINGKKIYKYFSRKTDADRWYLEKKREKELLNAGVKVQITPMKFGEFVEGWLTTRKVQHPISTWKTEEERLNGFILPKFESQNLHQISTGEWEVFLDNLVTKLKRKASTRNRYRTLLHKIYEDAFRKGIVADNPIRRVPKWKESSDTSTYFETGNDCRTYLAQAKREHVALYIFGTVALNIGLRLGEILALRNKDVDLEKKQIHVGRTVEYASNSIVPRTKGQKARWVPVSDNLFEVLREHRGRSCHNKPDDLLICYDDGSFFSESTLRKMHNRICKEAKLKSIRIHDLRHTFASHFVMNGGSLRDLQGILGHSTPNMTNRYAHLAPNHLLTKANVVSFAASTTDTQTERPKLRAISGGAS